MKIKKIVFLIIILDLSKSAKTIAIMKKFYFKMKRLATIANI